MHAVGGPDTSAASAALDISEGDRRGAVSSGTCTIVASVGETIEYEAGEARKSFAVAARKKTGAAPAHKKTSGKLGILAKVRAVLLREALTRAALGVIITRTTSTRSFRRRSGPTEPCRASISLAAKGNPGALRGRRTRSRCVAASYAVHARIPWVQRPYAGTVIMFTKAASEPAPTQWAYGFGLSTRYPNLKALGVPVRLGTPKTTNNKRTGTIVVQVCSYGGPAPGGRYCQGGGTIYIARLGRNGDVGKRTLTRQRTIHVPPGGYEVGLYETIDVGSGGAREEKRHHYGNAKIIIVRAGEVAEVTLEGPPIP